MFKFRKYLSILTIAIVTLGCSPMINRSSVNLNKIEYTLIGAFSWETYYKEEQPKLGLGLKKGLRPGYW